MGEHDHYTIRGIRIGGRGNRYGAVPEPPRVDIDQSKKVKQQPGGRYEHPPGAFSLAYSFTPYPPPPPYQYPYPPPPPWQYGGYGGAPPQIPYYGGYHGPGYGPDQFPSPNLQGSYYNYGCAAATGAPIYGHGQHDTGNDQLGHRHNYGEAHMNKGLPAATGAAANGGHGQDVAVLKHDHHDHSHGGGAAAAAATAVYSHG